MSHAANLYVKKLVKAPNGEGVSLIEKAVLWYLADSHREEEHAAWPGVPLIAEHNGISERRVREILGECIRKRIVWRDARWRDNGSATSNYWRFTAIDGEPPAESLVEEEKRRALGSAAAAKANQIKRAKRLEVISATDGPSVLGDEKSQEAAAEVRTLPCESSQGDPAEVRTLPCESSQGDPAEVRSTPLREFAGPESPEEFLTESPLNLSGTTSELSGHQHAAGALMSEDAEPVSADKNPAVQAGLKVWLEIKNSLRIGSAIRWAYPEKGLDKDWTVEDRVITESEWRLWVRTSRLHAVLSGPTLCVVVPPASRIMRAAQARLPALREMAKRRGYALALSAYPDEWQKAEIATRFPGHARKQLGARATA